MPYLRKYGTGSGADVYIPVIKRAVVDFAVSADWTPAAGDVKVSKDGAAAANITTLPTAITMGNTAMWKFVFSNAELQCKVLSVSVADSATKAVEDQFFEVETYGHASAKFIADIALANLPANVTQLLGTAWLTPGVAGTPDVNAKQIGATAQTGRDLGTSVLLSSGTGTGQVLLSSGKVSVPDTQKVDLNTIKTQSVTCAAGVTVLASVGTAAASTAQTGDTYALANGSSGFVATKADTAAILVDTNELQADWTNGGRLDLIVDAILVDTGTTLQAELDGIQADAEDIQARLPAALTADGNIKADALRVGGTLQTAGDIPSLVTTVDTVVDAIKTKTDQFVFTVANQVDANALSGGGGLDAAGVRSAVGLASANLDTQFADLPTVSEFNARTIPSADYFDPATDAVANVTLVATTTNLTNLPAITSNWLTAAGIAASALNGKGDWNVGKTGYSLTATTGLGNQTANITGNLSGSVGSVTGNVATLAGAATVVLTDASLTTAKLGTFELAKTTNITGFNDLSAAQINTEADTALADYDGPTNAEMTSAFTEIKGATWATTDTLEAIRDRGDAAWLTATGFSTHSAADVWLVGTRVLTANTNLNDPTAAAIADAVWLEAIADHSGTSGSTAEVLSAAGSAGDPWTTALPGAYLAGSAGYIIGTNLDAAVSSRGTSTLTQSQITGGAYALNHASFAFNSDLDFTTTQKAATLARVTLVDTLTTYTDNTPQTGDTYALANGASGFVATKADQLVEFRNVRNQVEFTRGHHTASGAIFYVDGVGGNDSTGDGTQALPWKTISKALTACTANVHDCIILLPNASGGPTTITESAPIAIAKSCVQIRGPGHDVNVTLNTSGNVFDITASGVGLSGFRVTTFSGASSAGVEISGGADFVRLEKLWIESSHRDGVRINVGNLCEVVNCFISSAGRDGIRMDSGAGSGQHNRMTGNIIRGCGGSGINMQGSDASNCSIFGNLIRDNVVGITVASGATNVSVTDNRLIGNGTSISDAGTGTLQMWNYFATDITGAVSLLAANSVNAAALASDAVTEIQNGLATPTNVTDAQAAIIAQVDANEVKIDNIQTSINTIDGIVDNILIDTNELQTDWANGGRLDSIIDLILADTGTDGIVISSTTANQIADAILTRDWTLVSGEAARSALNALRILRNKVSESGGTLTITKEDDSTTAWTALVTTDNTADLITTIDPS
jgi:hypothetical protein